MTFSHEHIAQLLLKRLNGELMGPEEQELEAWLAAPERSQLFTAELQEEQQVLDWLTVKVQDDRAGLEEGLLARIKSQINFEEEKGVPSAYRVRFLRTAWFRYAAAILLVIVGVALYYHFSNTSRFRTEVVQNVPPSAPNDILPGYNRAVLTLSDGKKVELDSAASETIKDGTLSIENNNGQLIYKKGEMVAMNTMSTPKGGQYQLTLADGTRVWLNAASAITYPTAFTGNTREVTITGEAYFEVSKNKEKPFIVKTNAEEITVLGTAFNVNAYPDEPQHKTSLAEGSVKINGQQLSPGQGYMNGKVIATNISQDIAWKNGLFDFNAVEFATAMRQLERWFDITVVYDGAVPKGKFYGQIGRNLKLQEVLEGLQGVIGKFRLEGKTLHVLP